MSLGVGLGVRGGPPAAYPDAAVVVGGGGLPPVLGRAYESMGIGAVVGGEGGLRGCNSDSVGYETPGDAIVTTGTKGLSKRLTACGFDADCQSSSADLGSL